MGKDRNDLDQDYRGTHGKRIKNLTNQKNNKWQSKQIKRELRNLRLLKGFYISLLAVSMLAAGCGRQGRSPAEFESSSSPGLGDSVLWEETFDFSSDDESAISFDDLEEDLVRRMEENQANTVSGKSM